MLKFRPPQAYWVALVGFFLWLQFYAIAQLITGLILG